jgi:serine/threonine protein kinase
VLYLTQAAYGLDRTHAEGIVHRDLKPENLFITYRDDGSPRLKLLDFGIAKVLGEPGERTRGILGTPLFISPEQVHGERSISPRTDVYALAHIAYNLLTGEPYWRQEESEAETMMPVLLKAMKGHTQPATVRAMQRRGVTLPPAFDAWFDKATAVDPDARHHGALAMVIELAAVFGLTVKPSQRVADAPPLAAPASQSTGAGSTSGAIAHPGDRPRAAPDPQPSVAMAPPGAAARPTSGAVTRTFAIEPKKSNVARGAVLTAVVLIAVVGLVFLVRQEPGSSRRPGADPEPTTTSGSRPTISEMGDLAPGRADVPPAYLTATSSADSAPAAASAPAVTPTADASARPNSSVPAAKSARPPVHLAPKPPAPSSTSPAPSATGWKPPVLER